MTRTGKTGARLLALALATGTMATIGMNGAVAATPVQQLSGTAGGNALQIQIYLPVNIPDVTVNHLLTLDVSSTTGAVTLDGTKQVLNTNALLGSSTLSLVNGLVDKTTHADLGSTSQTSSILATPLPAGLGTLDAGNLLSSVRSLLTDGTAGQSSSKLLGVEVTNVLSSEISSLLASATPTVDSAVNQVVTTVTNTVNSATSTLNTLLGNLPAPVQTTVKPVVTEVTTTLDNTLSSVTATVKSALSQIESAGDLVSIGLIDQSHTFSRDGKSLVSTAESEVGGLDVLGGLVNLKAIQSEVQATAGGAPGTAKVTFPQVPVADLSVGYGALQALVNSTGVHLLGDVASLLPPQLSSAQGTVTNALNSVSSLLNEIAGVSVNYGETSQKVAADGQQAAGAVGATTVNIDPPLLHTLGLIPAGQKLLTISLTSVSAAAGSRTLTPAAATTPTVVTPPVAKVPTAAPKLAYTGADLPLTGAIATGLLGSAFWLRRRRATSEA